MLNNPTHLLSKATRVFKEKGFFSLVQDIKRFFFRYGIKGLDFLDTCSACGSRDLSLFLKENPTSLYRCNQCDLIFFNPLPSKDDLAVFYSSEEGYIPSVRDYMQVYQNHYSNRVMRYEGFMNRIFERSTIDIKNVLDIGCGYGFFLLYCREKGIEPFGVEISRETSSWARGQGMEVFTGTVQEAPFRVGSFDLITSFHCLEHSLDPASEVMNISSLCRNKGLFLLAVPNAFSLVAEDSFSTWKWKSWPSHLFYFSPKNLKILLDRAGFDVIEIYSQVGDSDICDDRRAIRKQATLKDEEVDSTLDRLYDLNKGQELVVISRKRGA